MSIFSLNCRGLGDPQAVENLRLVLRRYSPKLVFLSETKKTASAMAVVKERLGNFDVLHVDCRGQPGGLALLRDK